MYALIWTTTPWTLPANCAVCYSDSLHYSLIKKVYSNSDDTYLVASELLPSVSHSLGHTFEVIKTFEGSVYFFIVKKSINHIKIHGMF